MTIEEAIRELKIQFVGEYNRQREAKDMAIKALEEQSVLDKIRAEIDLKQYDFMADKDYDEGVRFGLMLAYQIIGKYKTERYISNGSSLSAFTQEAIRYFRIINSVGSISAAQYAQSYSSDSI